MDEPDRKRTQSFDETFLSKRPYLKDINNKCHSEDVQEHDRADSPVLTALSRIKESRQPSGDSNKDLNLQLPTNFNESDLKTFVGKLKDLPNDQIRETLENIVEFSDVSLNIGASDTGNTLAHCACSLAEGDIILEIVLNFRNVNANARNKSLELPIHVAIKHDHVKSVNLLLEHDKTFLHALDRNGFGLIHKACKHLSINCIRLLIDLDPSCVNTFPKNDQFRNASVLSIAIGSYQVSLGGPPKPLRISDQRQKSTLTNDRELLRQISRVKSNKHITLRSVLIYEIDLILLEACNKNILMCPKTKSSIIHKLIEIQDIDGIKVVLKRFQGDEEFTSEFINSPNEASGQTPLLVSIDHNFIDIALILVSHGADPNRTTKVNGVDASNDCDDNRGQAATERAIQLCSDPEDIEPLLRELIKKGAHVIPALEAVIDTGDMSLARAIFDEVKDPKTYINHQDEISGETILHSCLASFRLKNETDDIYYLLEKGANVMILKNNNISTKIDDLQNDDTASTIGNVWIDKKLPIEVAIEFYESDYGDERVKSYLSAIRRHGISLVFKKMILSSDKKRFLSTHLLPAAYFVDYMAVDELLAALHSLNAPNSSRDIIHQSSMCSPYRMYQYPLLYWATFHSHIPLMNIIVRAEYSVHEKERKAGFECFRKLGNNPLREQAEITYTQMFSKTPKLSTKLLPTIFEVVFRLYTLFVLDIYFDLDLVQEYSKISDYVQNVGNRSIEFNFFEEADYVMEDYHSTGTDRYYVGKTLSMILIVPSILAFLSMSYTNFSISDELHRMETSFPFLHINLWKFIIYPFKPIIFLFAHFVRTLQSKAQPYDPYLKQKYNAGRKAWELIRRVEVGVEGSGQLILQLYLLSPLAKRFVLSYDSNVSILAHVWRGIGYYVTLSTLDATFAEKMGAKFFISSMNICASITRFRLLKNSATGLCRNGHYESLLCYFLSCLTQLTGRCMTLLLLFSSVDISPNYVLLFIAGHCLLTIVLKIILEVPPKGKYSSNVRFANIRGFVSSSINTFTSSILSAIIYVPIMKSDTERLSADPNEVNTFLSGLIYQFLIIFEHIILIGITALRTSEVYTNYGYVLWITPIVLWLLNLLLLFIYYRFLHRSKNLGAIGPKIGCGVLEHHAVLCFKIKHFYLDCKTCYCNIKDETNHELEEC